MSFVAQITNEVVPVVNTAAGAGDSGQVGAAILGRYIAVLLQTSMIIGALVVLVFMVWGALSWITSEGDKGKVEKARGRIVNSIIGLALLASVAGIATFLSPVFGFDLLRLDFINQIQGGGAKTPTKPGTSNFAPGSTLQKGLFGN